MEISVPNFLLDLCDKKNNVSYNGYNYSLNPNFFFEHKMIPLYIGMTSKAAMSRARSLAILIANPRLLKTACNVFLK